ncbi:hypothetical protein M501DRAFT_1048643 [Patellaria atrata CBS 101060]|uniref:Zn(2)-C6 fungal-type domain-containing protein n=1 Tax=Patellaria atrata CBS 101060 TaxID=1346257 RepID=A0A9P4VTL9_9PEZI|nr:hypothetical protein M501DRAFT_1048643 [Patellaria atrata CBS 101060]
MSNRPPSSAAPPSSTDDADNNTDSARASQSDPVRKRKQDRQKLSCTKCRDRKVKCDRTKPCFACCARGHPKECHFVVAEGSDYGPIQQSYEIRKLREENETMRKRLQELGGQTGSDDDQVSLPLLRTSSGMGSTRRNSRKQTNLAQQKFKAQELPQSLYFASPGIASIVNNFANLTVGPKSLTQSVSLDLDIYTAHNGPAYPFATMWKATPQECIPTLLKCLPPKEEIRDHLRSFQTRAQMLSFPYLPEEVTHKEVEHFLADAKRNVELFPDRLAMIFAALALGAQSGVFDKQGGEWVEKAMDREISKCNVFIAASMQALRMSSFMNRPNLISVQTLVMLGPYLTNSGRFLDAWTLFGTTIRLAHSIGLHRNPRYIDPTPSPREAAIRQTLWWWMLQMDESYSITHGRPLGISSIGDCPPPEPLTSNPTLVRLGEYVNQFTLLSRQILSTEILTSSLIDEFTDALCRLWDTVPESVRFEEAWLANCGKKGEDDLDWPLDAVSAVLYAKTNNTLILLNRQRHDSASHPASPSASNSPIVPSVLPNSSRSSTRSIRPSSASSSYATPVAPNPQSTTTPPRGHILVLTSCVSLLTAFLYTFHHCPAAFICWGFCQQAFNACTIILLDALETGNLDRLPRVEQAYAVFMMLARCGVHGVAGEAVGRIGEGIRRCLEKQQRGESVDIGLGREQPGPSNHPPTLYAGKATTQHPFSNPVPGAVYSPHPLAPPSFDPSFIPGSGSSSPTTLKRTHGLDADASPRAPMAKRPQMARASHSFPPVVPSPLSTGDVHMMEWEDEEQEMMKPAGGYGRGRGRGMG